MRWRAALTLMVLAVGVWIAVGPVFEGHIAGSELAQEVGVGSVIALGALVLLVHDLRRRASG
ncbi:MAG TPA: hypothetical protein VH134_14000 [Candidatus Dormibacteraeota bacterium]|nr:hypothetical protein [Candidatus Dormibacteraeota bacterium]